MYTNSQIEQVRAKNIGAYTESDKGKEKLADTNEILFENNMFILKKLLLRKTIFISVHNCCQ